MTLSYQFKRGAVAAIALLGMGAACAQVTPAAPRIGLQLWSVRDEVKQDFEGTLAKVAKLGFQGVEFAGELGPYAGNAAGLKAFMDKTGLACAGAHTNFDALSPAKFEATTSYYKTLGCRNLVIGMDKRAFEKDGATQVAKELTAMSAKLAPLGMRIGYHNHAEEMAGADGQTTWDLIATSTPNQTILQQDVGWTTFAGKDPVATVKRYPGRTISTHFKPKFLKGTTGSHVIGQDKTDWAGLTHAVRSVGGTEWIIVEQEDYPNGMGQLDSAAASLRGYQAVLAKMAAK
jgi:sugar phosphate isomerase/epimerase